MQPDFLADTIALYGLALVGVLVLGFVVAPVVRDSDWWVIARGLASGRCNRVRRVLRGVRRG
ncbi:hypothetical protein [Saccharopolyspora sp. 5N708]|uniref:hypothetical protein n=1 Tax=Saccharopolyspora sp. 5N708 TaxID=3457424 RepID=UPI003FD30104